MADLTDARCRRDQIDECRRAVVGGNFEGYANGGECVSNEYDIYDQLCSVNSYIPGTDYCCCPHDDGALCCRFHYDHKYFRCDEEQDTIAMPLTLTMTIIISVVAFFVLIIIIVISVKCAKGRRSGGKCCDKRRRKKPTNVKPHTAVSLEDGSAEPLNQASSSAPPGELSNNNQTGTSSDVTTGRCEPSAPPADAVIPEPPPYERSASHPQEVYQGPEIMHGRDHRFYRCESDNFEDRRHLAAISEAPPGYDEHHEHLPFHPEMNGAVSDRPSDWY